MYRPSLQPGPFPFSKGTSIANPTHDVQEIYTPKRLEMLIWHDLQANELRTLAVLCPMSADGFRVVDDGTEMAYDGPLFRGRG
jgi:hypothetical protein